MKKTLRIERGIPVAPRLKYPIPELKIGDSIVVRNNSQRAACFVAARRNGIRITTRKLRTRIRVTRIQWA